MFDIGRMPSQIDIGFTGEKAFRVIEINMSKWLEIMPDGVPSIVHIRPGETQADAYIANTTFEDGILRWEVSAGDLGSTEGVGEMQVWLEEEDSGSVVKRGKSILIATRINAALNDASETVPEAQEAWLEAMTALKVATVNAADAAEDAKDDAVAAKVDAVAAKGAAETAQGKAEIAQGKAEDAQGYSESAQAAAEAAMAKYPYVDVSTGNWMVWDPETSAWVNTGIHAKGDTGAVPNIQVGTVATGLPGSSATVTRRSGSPDTAPIFDFSIPKGDTGTAENIYGNTIDMTEEDSTKVATAIGNKADKVASAVNGNFAGLDSNGNLTDSGHKHSDYLTSHQDISGKLNKTEAAADYDNTATYDVGELCMYQGAFYRCNTAISIAEAWNSSHWTQTTVGEQIEHLERNIAKPLVIQLDNVSNVSGSYTHSTSTSLAVASMKPIQIECSDPTAFKDDVTVVVANGSITLSCDSVAGSSQVWVTVMKELNPEQADPSQITPSDFDVLAGRIGSLSSLTTTAKGNLVAAVNEVDSDVSALNSNLSSRLNIKRRNLTGISVAITTSYGSGACYYGNYTITGSDWDDCNEILGMTLFDYAGLGGVIMPQITGAKTFRLWSDKSQSPSSLSFKILYI